MILALVLLVNKKVRLDEGADPYRFQIHSHLSKAHPDPFQHQDPVETNVDSFQVVEQYHI